MIRPGEGQVYSDGTYRWFVHNLIEASKDLPVEERPVHVFKDLDDVVWEDPLTVRAIVKHVQRILTADLSCPVIVSQEGWIMDGCHRLAKALLNGRGTILVRQFKENPPCDELELP